MFASNSRLLQKTLVPFSPEQFAGWRCFCKRKTIKGHTSESWWQNKHLDKRTFFISIYSSYLIYSSAFLSTREMYFLYEHFRVMAEILGQRTMKNKTMKNVCALLMLALTWDTEECIEREYRSQNCRPAKHKETASKWLVDSGHRAWWLASCMG